jgi:hypothetical protein
MTASPPCRVVLTPAADTEYSLGFVLSNPTSQEIALHTYEPFLQFRLRASARGAAIAVDEPTLDIPVQPMTITVPASGTVDITTPVTLRFGARAVPSQPGFIWSIAHPAKGVELTFVLDLPPPFDQPCKTRV